MPPRDLSARRALIACNNVIEVIDLSEYLETQGWPAPTVVATAALAAEQVRNPTDAFALVVLATSHTEPDIAHAVDICSAAGAAVMIVNGATSAAADARVARVSRPYTDADLDAALKLLNLTQV